MSHVILLAGASAENAKLAADIARLGLRCVSTDRLEGVEKLLERTQGAALLVIDADTIAAPPVRIRRFLRDLDSSRVSCLAFPSRQINLTHLGALAVSGIDRDDAMQRISRAWALTATPRCAAHSVAGRLPSLSQRGLDQMSAFAAAMGYDPATVIFGGDHQMWDLTPATRARIAAGMARYQQQHAAANDTDANQ